MELNTIIKGLYKRIFKNPISTSVGLFLVVFSVIGLLMNKISFDQFAYFIPTIIGLFYVQDSFFKVDPDK